MRDYTNIDEYLDRLERDVYPQPEDGGHTALANEAISFFMQDTNVEEVLDLGCGEGFCQPIFESFEKNYTGVCLQRDYYQAQGKGRNVFYYDFSFLPFEDSSYDFLFSRHSLEHSPFPLITLMEWYRVSSKYLAIVLPAPEYWGKVGRNHYFVLEKDQWKALFNTVGFEIVSERDKSMLMIPENGEQVIEYWFLLEKK